MLEELHRVLGCWQRENERVTKPANDASRVESIFKVTMKESYSIDGRVSSKLWAPCSVPGSLTTPVA
jgi:hypothetical protein